MLVLSLILPGPGQLLHQAAGRVGGGAGSVLSVGETQEHPGQAHADQHQHQQQAALIVSLLLAVLGGQDDNGYNAYHGDDVEDHAHQPPDHVLPDH